MTDNLNRRLKGRIVEVFGSQARFAQIVGVRDAFVSRVVRGFDTLDDSEAKKWAKILRSDPSIFQGNRGACSQS